MLSPRFQSPEKRQAGSLFHVCAPSSPDSRSQISNLKSQISDLRLQRLRCYGPFLPPPLPLRRLLVAATLILLVLSVDVSAFADEYWRTDDARRVARGLRERNLFGLVDRFCSRELAREGIAAAEQADLVIEQTLARTAKAMAAGSSGGEAWDAALEPGRELLVTGPEHPRKLLIEFQLALVGAARGRFTARELRLGVLPEAARPEAIERLENCRRELESLLRAIGEALPAALRRTTPGDQLSADELQTLTATVNYQIAVCLAASAGLQPDADRLNQIDAVQVVLERLEQVRRQTGINSELNVACELLRAEVLGGAGDPAAARKVLASLDRDTVRGINQQRYWQLKLELSERLSSPELSELTSQIERGEANLPETEMAVLESLSRAAMTGQGSAEQLEVLRAWAARIQQRFGDGWGRLASRTLLKAAGSATVEALAGSDGGLALDFAIRTAELALAEGQKEEAISGFCAAAELARENPDAGAENAANGLRLAAKAGELLAEAGRPAEAAVELRVAALHFRAERLAPQVHLRACWYLRTAPVESATQEAVIELLDEQLATWPGSEVAGQALAWRAASKVDAGDARAALNDFFAIKASDPHFAQACDQASRFIGPLVSAAVGAERESLVRTICERMNTPVDLADEAARNKAVAGQWLIRTAAIRAWLKASAERPAWIPEALAPVLQTGNQLAREQFCSSLAVLAAAVVRPDGDVALLRQAMDAAGESAASPNWICEWLSLVNWSEESPPRATLELCATHSRGLDPGAQKTGTVEITPLLVAARIEQALGNHDRAAGLLRRLASDWPDRADLQLALARALAGSNSDRVEALELWRAISTRLKPQSENWFEARYEVARLTLEDGDAAGARKLLEYLKTVPPGWSQSSWAERLESLLERCRAASD